MKKVILSIVMLLGMLGNVNADPITAGSTFGLPIVLFSGVALFSDVKYEACNDKPYLTAKWKDSNYYFNVSQCDYDANPSKYVLGANW